MRMQWTVGWTCAFVSHRSKTCTLSRPAQRLASQATKRDTGINCSCICDGMCKNICMCLCLIQNYVVCDLQTHDFHCRPCRVHYLSKSVQVVHIMHILETLILQRSIKQQSSDESNCQRFPNRQTSQCTGGTGLPLMTSYMLPYQCKNPPNLQGVWKSQVQRCWTEASYVEFFSNFSSATSQVPPLAHINMSNPYLLWVEICVNAELLLAQRAPWATSTLGEIIPPSCLRDAKLCG